jgi:hypothetical protein
MNNVILDTGTPRDRAARECAISCASTEKKKRNAASIAIPQRISIDQSGWICPKVRLKLQLARPKIRSQLQFTWISIPYSLPSLK